MQITTIQHEGNTIFTIEGRVDASNAQQFEEQLLSQIDFSKGKVVLSLEHLDYISSAGLRVFLLVAKKAKESSAEVFLYAIQDRVYDVFEMTGFDKLFTIKKNKDEVFLN